MLFQIDRMSRTLAVADNPVGQDYISGSETLGQRPDHSSRDYQLRFGETIEGSPRRLARTLEADARVDRGKVDRAEPAAKAAEAIDVERAAFANPPQERSNLAIEGVEDQQQERAQ